MGSLLDVTLRAEEGTSGLRTDGSIPRAADRRIPCRRTLTHFYTLLAETGFAGFPGGSSPSGRPS